MMRIIVGMSGGVDSSVAALILLRAGHEVTGVTMRTWSGEEPADAPLRHGCFGPGEEAEIRQAQAVAAHLGIEHQIHDLTRPYRTQVLEYFRAEYEAGRTPNPCVRCNRTVKFGALLEQVRARGTDFDRFATGHYARITQDAETGRWQLRKGRDGTKDQTYFLSALTQNQLARTLFPLGEHTKAEVRQLARDAHLAVSDRPESQDFYPGASGALWASRPGPIVNREGEVLGQHTGVHHFTIGQRRGLGISAPRPLYVVAIDAKTATVTVGAKEKLLGWGFEAEEVHWVSIPSPDAPLSARVRIRYRHEEARALLEPMASGAIRVRFDAPQLAITPGQVAVFYADDLVLGCGLINRVDKASPTVPDRDPAT